MCIRDRVTKKIGKNDKSIIEDAGSKGIKLVQGSIVTSVYKNHKKRKNTFESENTKDYDIMHYLSEFEKLVKEIDEVIKGKNKS